VMQGRVPAGPARGRSLQTNGPLRENSLRAMRLRGYRLRRLRV
jgi:hypothetical protein